MGRKILFVTTDQQRYDTLGCNGGTIARTPVVDGLAAEGIRYERAVPQSVVCMPARSTMLTGQYPATHGVWMNGVPAARSTPRRSPTLLHRHGYRTALIGKAHFEPFSTPCAGSTRTAREPRDRDDHDHPVRRSARPAPRLRAPASSPPTAPPVGCTTRSGSQRTTRRPSRTYYQVLDGDLEVNAAGGGDTGAPQVKHNPIPRDWYHTDWVAERTIDWLDSLDTDDDWFCWMSFPDPHHPWDPPASELRPRRLARPRPARRLPRVGRASASACSTPSRAHWRLWYDGTLVSELRGADPLGAGDADRRPGPREVNALQRHRGRAHRRGARPGAGSAIEAQGWTDDIDVVFTTDHGELQGDFGLLFKGPYHTDSLMRLPLVWRPAPVGRRDARGRVAEPVGHVDLAPTFCEIAGLEAAEWMQGSALPVDDADADGTRHRGTC